MKKLLSLLATVSLVSTSTASIVACGDDNIKQDISTVISVTDLGDIHFHSFAGDDAETLTEIINQIRNLNPNVGDAQINISNINPTDEGTTATISVVGFNGSLTVTFTPLHLHAVPEPLSFPSTLWSTTAQLEDGTFLVAGGTSATNSFLASVDLSNSQIRILAQGSDAFPAFPRSIIELDDGAFLVAGGTNANGSNSFLASVDLSDLDNPQIRILAQGSDAFPSISQSMIQLKDGTILIAGGSTANGSNSFLASVDLSDLDNLQIRILAQGSTTFPAFPSVPWSIIKLQDGTILVAGGTSATNSFLASVDLSNSQVQILAQGPTAFPAAPRSITRLQDGTILVVGGNPGNAFLASVDLSNSQIQILAQGSTVFPSIPRSIIQLQDGTFLVVGGNLDDDPNPFLVRFNH